jgi:hypothetical protein
MIVDTHWESRVDNQVARHPSSAVGDWVYASNRFLECYHSIGATVVHVVQVANEYTSNAVDIELQRSVQRIQRLHQAFLYCR